MPLNIILITSDEMRADALGYMGNPDCRTPNIDSLTSKGVTFTNHFTVHGKCVPSRIAMQTGRYCHTDGYRTINLHMPVETPHLLGALKKMGYESAVFGHNHVWKEKAFWGQDNRKGTTYPDYHSYTADVFGPMIAREWPVQRPGPGSRRPMDLSREGFQYTGRIEKPLSGFCDDTRAEQAIHYLKAVRDRSRPFYLHLNFGKPHPAYCAEEPYFSMYDRAKIVPYPYALPANAPLHMTAMRRIRTGVDAPEDAFREIQALYYGMVTKVDLLAGRVLAAIGEEGLFANSIVLFTTDHGDFAGQYGLVEKWDTSLCDCIMRCPLILCAPSLTGGAHVSSLTEHIDLPSTILGLLGTAPDWGVHGESLLPAIRGERRKEAVFGDGGHEQAMWKRFNFGPGRAGALDGKQVTYRDAPESMARAKMVRTERWKLVVRLTGGNELYDMEKDPQEMRNLYPGHEKDPALAHVVADLQLKLVEWCLRTDTDLPFEEKVGA